MNEIEHSLQALPFWGDFPPSTQADILKQADKFEEFRTARPESILGMGQCIARIYELCEPYRGTFDPIGARLAGDQQKSRRLMKTYVKAFEYFPPYIFQEWFQRNLKYKTLKNDFPFGRFTDAVFSVPLPKTDSKPSARVYVDKVLEHHRTHAKTADWC